MFHKNHKITSKIRYKIAHKVYFSPFVQISSQFCLGPKADWALPWIVSTKGSLIRP